MTLLRSTLTFAGLGLLLVSGCPKSGDEGSKTSTPTNDTSKPEPQPEPTDDATSRPSMTNAECEAKGGSIVGDIGDGAIHKPDYKCANGQPPLGSIVAETGAPIAVEGSVCCGA